MANRASRIKKLSPSLIAKIAAGEVIERPASVIKELIDNSIDAGSSQVDILVEQSGLRSIRVLDNGHGMNKEDLLECFKPHTTSKIDDAEQLLGLESLGFRGEALASIAVTADITIASKDRDSEGGYELVIRNGKIVDEHPVGMPLGTKVTVEHLFDKVPARKSSLKTTQTELRHIIQTVSAAALANPEIGFTLKHNGKTLLSVPKNSTFEERLQPLLGERFRSNLLATHQEHPHLIIEGFLGAPVLGNKRSHYYLLVNGRPVRNPEVAAIIKECYNTLLEPRLHPFFVLSLEVPKETLDINIHPRKETIHFLRGNDVKRSIKETISQALAMANPTYQFNEGFGAGVITDHGKDHTAKVLRKEENAWSMREYVPSGEVSQLHNLYLIAETSNGLVVIDQHAAHERILYEQFLASFKEKRTESEVEPLASPVDFDLPLDESEVLLEHLQTLTDLGFAIEQIDSTTFRVMTVPLLLKDRPVVSLIREAISDISENSESDDILVDSVSHRIVTYIACRSAIKAGDPLSPDERKRLIEKWNETKNRATCPHGRPVLIEMNLDELNKKFKR